MRICFFGGFGFDLRAVEYVARNAAVTDFREVRQDDEVTVVCVGAEPGLIAGAGRSVTVEITARR